MLLLRCHRFQNGRQQNRKIVNGLWFQWKLITRIFWSEELLGALNSDMGIFWGVLFLHPNTIKPSYYHYYYSSSSSYRRELVWPNSQRMMIRSLPNFTGKWIPISRGAFRSWNFQNDRRCHGNREPMSNLWPHLYRKPPKEFPQSFAYILKRVVRIFWPNKIVGQWPPF